MSLRLNQTGGGNCRNLKKNIKKNLNQVTHSVPEAGTKVSATNSSIKVFKVLSLEVMNGQAKLRINAKLNSIPTKSCDGILDWVTSLAAHVLTFHMKQRVILGHTQQTRVISLWQYRSH